MSQSGLYPIFTIRNKMGPPKPKTHIMRRNHNNKNIELFRKKIKIIDWDSLYRIFKIETDFLIFTKTIVLTFQNCFPLEIIKLIIKTLNDKIKT